LISIIAIIITLLLATLFVAAEFALVKVRRSALEELQAKRDKPSKNIATAIHMVEHLNEYLSTTQVGITLAGLIIGWLGEETVSHLLLDLGVLQKLPGASAGAVASIIALALLTYIEVVFTELLPKNLAIEFPMKVMLIIVRPLHWAHQIFYPFVWFLNKSAEGALRMFGLKAADEGEEIYSEAEILSLSRAAAKTGELEVEEVRFMERAFEMTEKVAVDIMIDRTQMTVVDVTTPVSEALQLYFETKHTRLPVVANNDKDKVIGYVRNYDLMRQSREDETALVGKIVRTLPIVSENFGVTDTLAKMMKVSTPMAVVKDEYGGTSGIITDTDIYEELFGVLRDENTAGNSLVKELAVDDNGDMHYQVSGKLTLYDFERYFNTDIKAFDNSDMVTLTGYVLDLNPDIQKGQTVHVGVFAITPLDSADDAYIDDFDVVLVTKAAEKVVVED
jgi:CBS domain containing-hemolysin-like protein